MSKASLQGFLGVSGESKPYLSLGSSMKSENAFLLYNNNCKQKTSKSACEHFIVSVLFVSHKILFLETK